MTLSAAYEKHPQHRIEIDDELLALRVTLNGEVLAETTHGLNLREGKYPPVVYVPRKDVNLERLIASDHTTHCPFKGDASYFDYLGNDQNVDAAQQVAWSYETPFDQMAAIRGHLAFDSNLVTIEPLER
jgi:uncharacterized protein (DUF427 family)